MRILLVECDLLLGDAIQRRLRRDGYAVDWQQDGECADELLRRHPYKMVVLADRLPCMGGHQVLRALRRRGDRTPVLLMTSCSTPQDRIEALDIGADVYLTKPFDPGEFDARCRVLLRRAQGLSSGVTKIGLLTVNRAAKTATIAGRKLNLPNREYRLLDVFVCNLGSVLSKDHIASQLFDFDNEAGSNAVELYVGRLRRKLGEALSIRTLRGSGYVAGAPQPMRILQCGDSMLTESAA